MGAEIHQQWEYKTLEPPKGLTKRETVDPTDELNRLGTEGGELAERISYDGGGTKLLLFKRQSRTSDFSTDNTLRERTDVSKYWFWVLLGANRWAVTSGDGTLHEVVRGLVAASALGEVTLGVLPTGTENIFATNIGVTGTEEGFELLDHGERRGIDVGFAGGEPLTVSCIAGVPAEISVAASSDLKERFGSLAFVAASLQELTEFAGLQIDLTAVSNGEETTWSGEVLCRWERPTIRQSWRAGQRRGRTFRRRSHRADACE